MKLRLLGVFISLAGSVIKRYRQNLRQRLYAAIGLVGSMLSIVTSAI